MIINSEGIDVLTHNFPVWEALVPIGSMAKVVHLS